MKKTGSQEIPNFYDESADIPIHTISKDLSNSPRADKCDDLKEPIWKCRYTITLTGFLITLLTSYHRTLMTVAIVAMVNNTAIGQKTKATSDSCPDLVLNSTEKVTVQNFKRDGEFIWSPETQGYILGSLFIGHIISQIPAGRLAERYGCKWILVATLFSLSILTMLIPPFSRFGSSAVIVIQILRGLLLGIPIPLVTILVVNWSPKTERGFLFSLIQPAYALGPALGNILSGYICQPPGGWPYAFYSIGCLGLLLAAYMSFYTAENPKECRGISKAEFNFILSQQENKLLRKRPKLPWRKLLTSVPVYALICGYFGLWWAVSQFLVVHSTFLGTILHYPIAQNGLFSAAPFFLAALTAVIASVISSFIQKAKVVSITFLRKFWTFTSSTLYSLCVFGVYTAGCNRNLSVIFSILSTGCYGLSIPGAFIVPQDMTPIFSGTLHAIVSTFGYIASVILPLVVGYLTGEKQTLEQWNKVFLISIGVVMCSATLFTIFASAEIQPWNFVSEEIVAVEEKKRSKTEAKNEESRF